MRVINEIKEFKKRLLQKFPGSALDKVLLVENDLLSEIEFLVKLQTWLKLAR